MDGEVFSSTSHVLRNIDMDGKVFSSTNNICCSIFMDEKLTNHDLIRHLCASHDEALSKRQVSPDEHFSDDEETGET